MCPTAPLVEHAIRNGEATIVAWRGAVRRNRHHTGRSPKDKHAVVDALTENTVWWEERPSPAEQELHNLLFDDFIAHAKGKTLYAQDLYGGADHEIPHQGAGLSPNSPGTRCSSARS